MLTAICGLLPYDEIHKCSATVHTASLQAMSVQVVHWSSTVPNAYQQSDMACTDIGLTMAQRTQLHMGHYSC